MSKEVRFEDHQKALKIMLLKVLAEEGIKMNLFAFWFLRIHHVMKQFRN
ncbi:hypothetical protein AQPE_3888 [Aquipluma nitroreducens]|uniref:Uncharacterized protein n=1 Tax=Aquipluma nitroreducens TaxID=2010828 RepID=A0A5K7SDQ6_9BACT|nr:hypothetical protein AQPE_3888 [Aquipluma nitroreducens]